MKAALNDFKDDEYIQQLNHRIGDLYEDLKRHGVQLQTPQGKALTETSAEVVGGIKKAFEVYLAKSGESWHC